MRDMDGGRLKLKGWWVGASKRRSKEASGDTMMINEDYRIIYRLTYLSKSEPEKVGRIWISPNIPML